MRFLCSAALLALATPLVAQTPERHTLRGSRVVVYDLVGDVRIVPGSGADVVVEVTRQGRDAGQLRVESDERGGVATLRVIFPFDRVRYGDAGNTGRSTLRVRDDGVFGESYGGRRIELSTRDGADAAANLLIRVPENTELEVKVAAGDVTADGTRGPLTIDGIDTDVTLSGTTGVVRVETVSGNVETRNTSGDLILDTASGNIEVTGSRGAELMIDTGSGSVRCVDVTAERLDIDSGSGEVDLLRTSVERVRVDVGSGSVDIGVTRQAREISIETGSGGVTLHVPAGFGAELDLETGSGDIESDLPITIHGKSRGEMRGRMGDGSTRLNVSTGSGAIRIRRA